MTVGTSVSAGDKTFIKKGKLSGRTCVFFRMCPNIATECILTAVKRVGRFRHIQSRICVY